MKCQPLIFLEHAPYELAEFLVLSVHVIVCSERNIMPIQSHSEKRKNDLKLMVHVASRHLDQRSFLD